MSEGNEAMEHGGAGGGAAVSQTRDLADERLTEAVLASVEHTASPRLRAIMRSLVAHLHAFVRDVEPTEEEWFAAVDFLTRTGQISHETRQEFILLSDTLGVSMLVIGINNRKPPGATEATIFGPFHTDDAPRIRHGEDLAHGASGDPCYVHGHVRSVTGEPIPHAHLDVWQADDQGFYDVQYEGLDATRGRGQLDADAAGRYTFWSVKPESYPIPGDGPVGEMMQATNRSLMRAAHVHFRVSAPGHETVTTHIFCDGDPYLDSDSVFGVKDQLIAPFEQHEAGTAPDGSQQSEPFWTVGFDFVLAPATAATTTDSSG